MTRAITLAEVAKATGVTQMTASRALNNRPGVSREKRDEIQRIADQLGYVVSRQTLKFAENQSRIIGVITPELHNSFVTELVVGAGRAARMAGYEMLVYSLADSDHHPSKSVLSLVQQSTAGVVALLPYEYEYLDALVAARLPVITVDQRGQHSKFPSIAADSYDGARRATQHLFDLGHRRIAFVTGDERLGSALDRHRGYRDSLVLLGCVGDPKWVAKGDFTERGGYAAAKKLLALPERPTAIMTANDLSAFGVMAALRDAGLGVPEDISVLGFDDIPAASQIHPGLTTVRQPMQQMGRSAVNTLLAVIARLEPASSHIILPTELVVRGTTAPPKP